MTLITQQGGEVRPDGTLGAPGELEVEGPDVRPVGRGGHRAQRGQLRAVLLHPEVAGDLGCEPELAIGQRGAEAQREGRPHLVREPERTRLRHE